MTLKQRFALWMISKGMNMLPDRQRNQMCLAVSLERSFQQSMPREHEAILSGQMKPEFVDGGQVIDHEQRPSLH